MGESTPRTFQGPRTFSLVEIAVALLLLSAVAAVAVPAWQGKSLLRAEDGALATLRDIHRAQLAWASRSRDASFAFLPELAGADLGRGSQPPLLSGLAPGNFVFERDHYLFAVYLLTDDGLGLLRRDPELPGPFLRYVAYAWPRRFGSHGRQIFAMDETGSAYVTENAGRTREGHGDIPPFSFIGSALGADHPLTKAAHQTDGQRWSQVEAESER